MPAIATKGPTLNEIRLAVKALLPDGHPVLAAVAAELGISARTLQRRLAGAGLSHSQMVRLVRQHRAIELLARPSVSLKDIASSTGFASPSGFSRAFRAWTGMSPGRYRRRCDFGAK